MKQSTIDKIKKIAAESPVEGERQAALAALDRIEAKAWADGRPARQARIDEMEKSLSEIEADIKVEAKLRADLSFEFRYALLFADGLKDSKPWISMYCGS